MPLDLATLSVVAGILGLVQAAAFLSLWRLNPDMPGVGRWTCSAALNATGFALYASRGIVDATWLTMLAPVALQFAGTGLFLAGARDFAGEVRPLRWPWIAGGVLLAGYAALLWAWPTSPLRPVLTGATFGIFLLLGVRTLARIENPLLRPAARLVAVATLLMVASLVYRAIALPLEAAEAPVGLFTPVAAQAATFVSSIIWTLAWTSGAGLLVAQRRQVESREAGRRLMESERALAAERVRSAILRDLHDGLGGATSSLALLAGKGRAESDSDLLRRIETLAIEGNRELRLILNSLEAVDMTWAEWLAELRERSRGVSEALGVDLQWVVEGALPTGAVGDRWAARSLIRAGLEAATNAARHSGQTKVEARVRFAAEGVEIHVRDHGRGLAGSTPGGRGLPSLRKRATELGGRLDLGDAKPGLDLRISVPLPLRLPNHLLP